MKDRIIILHNNDRIHLKSKQGIYTVVMTMPNSLYISCRTWQARANHPNFIVKKEIKYSDIKCLAGGMNRIRVKVYSNNLPLTQ